MDARQPNDDQPLNAETGRPTRLAWGAALLVVAAFAACPATQLRPADGAPDPRMRLRAALHAAEQGDVVSERKYAAALKALLGEDDRKPREPVEATLPRDVAELDDDALRRRLTADPGLVSAVDAAGFTLLHDAADRGLSRRVSTLLAAGADPNARDLLLQTPLHRAAWAGNLEAIIALLEAGALLDARDVHGHTALHRAAWAGHFDAARALVAAGAVPDARSETLETPLIMAASLDHAGTVAVLLDAGARQPARSARRDTALQRAAERGHLDALRALLEADPDPALVLEAARSLPGRDRTTALGVLTGALRDPDARTEVLHLAARRGTGEDVAAVIGAGADPLATRKGLTPIEAAADSGNARPIAVLAPYDGGAAPGKRPLDRALLVAARRGFPKVLPPLMDAGALRDTRDDKGRTATHLAASAPGRRTLETLLELGFDPNARDRAGETPMHVAVRRSYGGFDAAGALFAHGGDLNAAATDGTRPLWLAISRGKKRLAYALIGLGAVPGPHAAVMLGDTTLLKRALKHRHSEIDALDRKGLAPLHRAVEARRKDLVRILLKAGANPNVASRPKRETPLHVAVERLEVDVVRMLLRAKADPNAADAKGRTPVHAVAVAGHRGMARMLVRAGGDPDRKDLQGKTPRSIYPELFEKGSRLGGLGLGGVGHGGGGRTGYGRGGGGSGSPSPAPGAGGFHRRRSVDLELLPVRQSYRPAKDVGTIGREVHLARELVARGRYREAERLWRDALALLERSTPMRDDIRIPSARNNLGRTITYRGHLAEAARVLEAAVSGLEADTWSRRKAWAVARENLAHVRALQGRLDEAITGYRDVLKRRLGKRKRADARAAVTLEHLGIALSQAGRYRDAEQALRGSIAGTKRARGYDGWRATAQLNLGVLHLRVGDRARASRAFEDALAYAEQAEGRDEAALAAVAATALAQIELASGQARPARLAEATVALRAAYGDDHEALIPAELTLAELRIATGDQVAAKRHAARARRLVERLYGPDHARMVEVLLVEARLAEAPARAALLQEALLLADANAEPELQWGARVALADVLAGDGKPRAAAYLLKEAVTIVEDVRAQAGALGATLVQDRAGVYRNLASLLVDQGRLAEAQAALELLKAEELSAFTRRSGPRPGAPGLNEDEEALRERFREVRGRLAALSKERAELRQLRREGPLAEAQKTRLTEIRKDLRVVRERFAASLSTLERDLADQGRQSRDLRSLRALQGTLERLDPHAVAIHYVVGPERTHILLTTSEVQLAETVRVKSSELYRSIQALREALLEPDRPYLEHAQALYTKLLEPIATDLDKLGAKTLVLGLDGALRYVPFAVLHDGRRHVAERYGVVLFTEATRDKLSPASKPPERIAGLGVSAKLGAFSALPAVPAELRSIVREGDADADGVLPGVVRLDGAFDADALRDVLDSGFPLVHVASHFELRAGTWRDSFLLMGDGRQLTLEDIRYDDYDFRNVDMVTLSACNTGMGVGGEPGREVEGLGALAVNLGARSVVATLWPVTDESTGMFMRELYRLRASDPSISKSEAMRRVQVRMLRGSLKPADALEPKPFAHPHFWAPFVLMGNWL